MSRPGHHARPPRGGGDRAGGGAPECRSAAALPEEPVADHASVHEGPRQVSRQWHRHSGRSDQRQGYLGFYEDQDATQLHRTQFVGRITSTDGSSIDFETAGYFVPRRGAVDFWDLTSAVYFFSANGPALQSLQGALGVWEGDVDTRTFRHRYRLRLLQEIGKSE